MKDVTGSFDAYSDVCLGILDLVEEARRSAIRSVNAFMAATYWEVGRRIVEFEQSDVEHAAYGEELIKRLSGELSLRFGRGFSPRNIAQMKGFYLAWPYRNILQTPSAKFDLTEFSTLFQLPWSAYVKLLAVKNESARQFYEAETMRCGWSVRQLDRQINSQFYERAALSKNKAAMLKKSAVTLPEDIIKPEEIVRDPFVLEFLNLKDEYPDSVYKPRYTVMATYILVHGGDRDGSIWGDTAQLLKNQGHAVFCPSMSSVTRSTLQQNINEIVMLIQANGLNNIILVGHSYGAMVITGVAEKLRNVVSFMVFVDSAIPENGKSLYELLAEYGFDYRSFGLTPDPACLEKLFFDSAYFAKMPKAYIHCLCSEFKDAIQPMYEHIVARAKADHWLYFSLDTVHGCMFTQPRELVTILAGVTCFLSNPESGQ